VKDAVKPVHLTVDIEAGDATPYSAILKYAEALTFGGHAIGFKEFLWEDQVPRGFYDGNVREGLDL
jgi:hypothetical protein